MNDCQILAEELQAEAVADRRRAAKMLAMLAEEAQSAAIAMLHAVTDADEEVCNWISEALENLGPPQVSDAQTIANLAVTAAHPDTQYFACSLLGRLGPRAHEQYPEIAGLVRQTENPVIKNQALKTAARIAAESQRNQLRQLVEDCQSSPDPAVKATATRILSRMNEATP